MPGMSWSPGGGILLLGALLTKQGWAKVGPAFEWLASRLSRGESFEYEVIAAGQRIGPRSAHEVRRAGLARHPFGVRSREIGWLREEAT
jgi:hypothetical protein